MAAKKKAKPAKDPADDIPPELAEEIQDAVSMEDEPSKQARSSRIPITHYEDDKDEAEAIDVTEPRDDEEVDKPDDKKLATEVDEKDDSSEEVDSNEEIEVVVEDAEEAEEPEDTEETVEAEEKEAAKSDTTEEEKDENDDHEWHLIEDEEATEQDEETEAEAADDEKQVSEIEDDESRPEWDDEKWQQANVEDETEEERPEWDEEKWQQANIDEEEVERPEWDEEKWQQAKAETDSATDNANDEEQEAKLVETTVAAEKKQDESVTEPEEEELDKPEVAAAESVPEKISDTEEDVEVDQRSASQVAINDDEEDEKPNRFNIKQLPMQFVNWWKRAKLRNSMVTSMAVILLVFLSVPSPRYAVLNTVGVRATASVAVIDAETQLPLKEVQVSLSGQETLTNQNGIATFDDVRLGSQQMMITKSAYDVYTQSITIGVGSNTIEPVGLVAIGTSFDFKITDWLTNEPIDGAEVKFDQNSAFVDDQGVAKLNTPTATEEVIEVTASAPGYADKMIEVDTSTKDVNEIDLVLERHHLFVSKRDGNYDIYKVRADGSDEQILLKGTGDEGSKLRFDTSPSGDKSVLVAVRDKNIKNDDDFVLSGLFVIDTETGEFEEVDSSERIDLVGWIGDRIVYVKIQAGASGRNPERHRLVSYDTKSGELNQIASSNYFNDLLVAKNYVFYAPSDAYKQNPKPYLFRSNADGSIVDTVFEKTVWTVIRTGINEIKFDSDQVWYTGEIDRVFNVETERPAEFTSRLYTLNRSGDKAAWVDIRDGKGALIVEDVSTGDSTTVTSLGGLRNPIVWLSDSHLIFRVVTSTETADYVLNINGGDAVKIDDVTDISGTDRWYYYY